MIHIYHGNGKGKTTAAVGVCIRALGAGMTVGLASFLKDGTSSELSVLRTLDNMTVYPCIRNIPFVFAMSESEKKTHTDNYEALCRTLCDNMCTTQVLVLDEFLDAINSGFVSEETVAHMIDTALSCQTELIITGRNPSDELIKRADYVTAMTADKHPFEDGINARLGIEY